jgi:hypothetical protein
MPEKAVWVIPLLYLLAISAAELVTALVSPLGGIGLHIVLLLALVIHASLAANHPYQKLYLALSLAPLTRLLSLSMPLADLPQIYWYGIIAIPLLIAIFVIAQRLNFRPREIGLSLGKLPLQIAIIPTGIIFGLIEYQILKPEPLIDSLTWTGIWLPALILLIATGFVEELTFRGVMQHSADEAQMPWGWVYITGIFAILHIGYLSVADITFVFLVGAFFVLIVKKTGSLLGVSLAHGITNIALYLIIPFLA